MVFFLALGLIMCAAIAFICLLLAIATPKYMVVSTVLVVMGLAYAWFAVMAGQGIYDRLYYRDVCTAQAKVVSLEQANRSQYIYALDNGRRTWSMELLSNGDTVCLTTERRRK